MSSRGRRPAGADTRLAIVDAAREEFARKGYEATSLRGVARSAGVDPALVHHYFDGKSGLFAAVMEIPLDPSTVISGVLTAPREDLGATVVRTFLEVWDTPDVNERLVGLVRSAVTHDDAARMMREFLTREIFGRLVHEVRVRDGRLGDPGEDLAAGLAASQMVGLAMLRYVIGHPPVVDAAVEDLVALAGPTLQRYLTA